MSSKQNKVNAGNGRRRSMQGACIRASCLTTGMHHPLQASSKTCVLVH
jgi:hypothetical protein